MNRVKFLLVLETAPKWTSLPFKVEARSPVWNTFLSSSDLFLGIFAHVCNKLPFLHGVFRAYGGPAVSRVKSHTVPFLHSWAERSSVVLCLVPRCLGCSFLTDYIICILNHRVLLLMKKLDLSTKCSSYTICS